MDQWHPSEAHSSAVIPWISMMTWSWLAVIEIRKRCRHLAFLSRRKYILGNLTKIRIMKPDMFSPLNSRMTVTSSLPEVLAETNSKSLQTILTPQRPTSFKWRSRICLLRFIKFLRIQWSNNSLLDLETGRSTCVTMMLRLTWPSMNHTIMISKELLRSNPEKKRKENKEENKGFPQVSEPNHRCKFSKSDFKTKLRILSPKKFKYKKSEIN